MGIVEEIYKSTPLLWRTDDNEAKIKEIIQTFMYNEKLHAEIVRTTMLTCRDVGAEDDLLYRLQFVFDMIYSSMERCDVTAPEAWRILANTIKYGTEQDFGQVVYDYDSATNPGDGLAKQAQSNAIFALCKSVEMKRGSVASNSST